MLSLAMYQACQQKTGSHQNGVILIGVWLGFANQQAYNQNGENSPPKYPIKVRRLLGINPQPSLLCNYHKTNTLRLRGRRRRDTRVRDRRSVVEGHSGTQAHSSLTTISWSACVWVNSLASMRVRTSSESHPVPGRS